MKETSFEFQNYISKTNLNEELYNSEKILAHLALLVNWFQVELNLNYYFVSYAHIWAIVLNSCVTCGAT